MNKRVREIIKMHMNAGLIQPTTWISIIDLSAGKEKVLVLADDGYQNISKERLAHIN